MTRQNAPSIPICSCLIEHHEDGTVIERRDPHCRVHGDGTRVFSVTLIPPDGGWPIVQR